jgi:hypothetical protein
MTKKAIDQARRAEVRRLFVKQFPTEERAGNDVLKFYGWLQQYHAGLLPKEASDSYQSLKVDLSGLYKD